MKIQEHINYWLKSAAHDLEAAETLFDQGRYDWSLFLGHLVIEKTLKAFYVRDNQNQAPPFTHNLSIIASHINLSLTADQENLLLELNQFNLRTRYPDYKLDFYKKCTFQFTEPYFLKVRELYKWLLRQI